MRYSIAYTNTPIFKVAREVAPFRLEALPAELRNYIYHLAVVDHEPLAINRKPNRLRSARQPAVTRVSRTLRDQLLPVFYGENIFVVNSGPQGDFCALEWARTNEDHMRYVRCLGAIMAFPRSSRTCYTAIYIHVNNCAVESYQILHDGTKDLKACVCNLKDANKRADDLRSTGKPLSIFLSVGVILSSCDDDLNNSLCDPHESTSVIGCKRCEDVQIGS